MPPRCLIVYIDDPSTCSLDTHFFQPRHFTHKQISHALRGGLYCILTKHASLYQRKHLFYPSEDSSKAALKLQAIPLASPFQKKAIGSELKAQISTHSQITAAIKLPFRHHLQSFRDSDLQNEGINRRTLGAIKLCNTRRNMASQAFDLGPLLLHFVSTKRSHFKRFRQELAPLNLIA